MIIYGYDTDLLDLDVRSWAGPREALALCPFHGDHHASMCFNVVSGLFICYACGERGGVYKLARQTGGMVSMSLVDRPTKSNEVEWLSLEHCPLALGDEYLLGRGVTDYQVEKHEIRRHPHGIVVPIKDINGITVGALMRRKQGEYRYLVFGERTPLWPMPLFHDLASQPRVALVEGVFGALSAERADVPALATLGAAVKRSALTHLATLKPLVIFDDDQAGYLGAGRVLVSSPLASVVVPGLQADELSPREWRDLWRGRSTQTRNLSDLANLSGNATKFWSSVKSTRKTISYRDYYRKSISFNGMS